MKKYKIFLILSLIINFVLLSTLGIVIYKKYSIKSNAITLNKHRESLFEELTTNSNDIVFFGDSLTQRCEWSELLGDSNIRNRGIDSNKTSDILNRVDTIIKGKPKKIFIMIGINDILDDVDSKTTLNNYNEIIEKIKNDTPNTTVYIQSVLPTDNKKTNEKVVDLDDSLIKLAKDKNIEYVDIYGEMINENGVLKDGLSKDGVHLMADGYNIWKDKIKEYVN